MLRCKKCGSKKVFQFEFDTAKGGRPRIFKTVNDEEHIEMPRRIEGYYCEGCMDTTDVYYTEKKAENYSSNEFEAKLIEAAGLLKQEGRYIDIIEGVEEKLLESLTLGAANIEVVKGVIRTKNRLTGAYNWELEKLKDNITNLIRLNEEAR